MLTVGGTEYAHSIYRKKSKSKSGDTWFSLDSDNILYICMCNLTSGFRPGTNHRELGERGRMT